MNIKYRVIIKVGYYATWFDFDSANPACDFATSALTHMVPNEDNSKKTSINIQVVDVDMEKAGGEDE